MIVYKFMNHQQKIQDFLLVNFYKEDHIKIKMDKYINHNI
jgi:hypothetical protein